VRLRRRALLAVACVLGAAVVALPAIASSETPPRIEAYGGTIASPHYWLPASATVAPGGTVKFANPYPGEPHGLKFTGGPSTPSCSGIPAAAGEPSGATAWQGECTFTAPGTYSFICTVHPSEMTGTITVSADGTTTTTTTTSTTTGTSTETHTGTTPGPSGGAAVPGAPGAGSSSLLAGGASSAVKLVAVQHGPVVRGSLTVSSAASGGTLEVQLLAARAALASAGRARQILVGHLVHRALHPGRAAFVVTLDSRARQALRLRGRLALSVRILLSSVHGARLRLSRGVVLRG
jgi:plastocyanin